MTGRDRKNAGTRGIISWAIYDWANQPFGTLIHTFVFSVYFTQQIAETEEAGSAQWGTALGLAGIVVAVSAPILGAMADQGGRRKPWILGFTLVCVTATALLWFVAPTTQAVWPALLLVGVATLGSELAVVFYNSLLPQLVAGDRIGRWSGWSWALGYTGGLASLAIALGLVIGPGADWIGLDTEAGEHVRIVAVFVAGWYLLFALPLFLFTPDAPRRAKSLARMASDGLGQIRATLREARRFEHIVRFLVAHMVYKDGLATLFAFGGIYAAGTFGLSPVMVLVFGVVLNVTAGIGAFAFAWIDDRIGSKATILVSLIGLAVPGTLILLVDSMLLFWVLGMVLGVFVGPAQAAGRSMLARMAPENLRSEMFGLFALSGKATAFVGPLLVGWVTYWAGSQRIGMGTIVVFFVAAFALMLTVPAGSQRRSASGKPV